ncbi:MAG: DMT family transporter [Candidatus Ratteibacteria bacterium]|jgi:hypothetical protein
MDVKQINQFASDELLRIVWKLGKDIVEHDVEDIVVVLCEYLQNAHDSALACDLQGEFKATFTPSEFSFCHNLGIWNPSNVESVFIPGNSDKDEHSGMVGRLGVGSLSAFHYATEATVVAPGKENTYEICVNWTKQQKVVSELPIQTGERKTLFVFKAGAGADYTKDLEDLHALLNEPSSLIWRLGIPFLDHISKVLLEVHLNKAGVISSSRLAINKSGSHQTIVRFESEDQRGEEVYVRAEHIVNDYSFIHLYRLSSQLPDTARFFRVFPLAGSESVPFFIFTSGDFPFDHRRRMPSARIRMKPSTKAFFDAYVESIAGIIENSVTENNDHLNLFSLPQTSGRNSWSMLGNEVSAILRSKNMPVYICGHPISVRKIRLDEVMFDGTSLGSASTIAPEFLGSTTFVAIDRDSHEFSVLGRFFECQPYTVSEIVNFYGNATDDSLVRDGLTRLLKAGESLPRKTRRSFYNLISETRISVFGGRRVIELASPMQNPYLSENIKEQDNLLTLPKDFTQFTRIKSSCVTSLDIVTFYRRTQDVDKAMLATLYEACEMPGDSSKGVRFVCDVFCEMFPGAIWSVSWRPDIRPLFASAKSVMILDNQVSLGNFRGSKLHHIQRLLEETTESPHNIRTFVIALQKRLGHDEPLRIPEQRALFQLFLRYRSCWNRQTDGSLISRLRHTSFITDNGMVGQPNEIFWDLGNLRGLIPGPFIDKMLVIELAEQGDSLSRQLGFRHIEDLSETEVRQSWSLPPTRFITLFRSRFPVTTTDDTIEISSRWRSLPRLLDYLKAHPVDDLDEWLLFSCHNGEPRRAADSIIVKTKTPEDVAVATLLDAGQASGADVLALNLAQRIGNPKTLLERRAAEIGQNSLGWLIALRERSRECSVKVSTLVILLDAAISKLANEAYDTRSVVFNKRGGTACVVSRNVFESRRKTHVDQQSRIPVPRDLIPSLYWARFIGCNLLVPAEELLIESWKRIVDELIPPLLNVVTRHVETVSEPGDLEFAQRLVSQLYRPDSLLVQTMATEQAKQALFDAIGRLESRLRLPQRGFRIFIASAITCLKFAVNNILLSPFMFVGHGVEIAEAIRGGKAHGEPGIPLRTVFGLSLFVLMVSASIIAVVQQFLNVGYHLPEFIIKLIGVGLILSAFSEALVNLTIPKILHFSEIVVPILLLITASVVVLAKATVMHILGAVFPPWHYSAIAFLVFAAWLFFIAHIAAGDRVMALRGLSVLLTAVFAASVLGRLASSNEWIIAVNSRQQPGESILQLTLDHQQPGKATDRMLTHSEAHQPEVNLQDMGTFLRPHTAERTRELKPTSAALLHLHLFNNAYQQILDQTKPPFDSQRFDRWLRLHENE